MNNITINDISQNDITTIKALWERNRVYHANISKHFSKQYKNLSFDERMKPFINYDKDKIKITCAYDNDIVIAFCISTITKEDGEICSLHVAEEYRNSGIGKAILQRHIAWLKSQNCGEISLEVSYENISAIKLYEALSFKKNTITMQLT